MPVTRIILACFFFMCSNIISADTKTDGWYTEGNFIPNQRIKISLTNTLSIDRVEFPVTIHRYQLPVQNIPYEWITVVDPSLPSKPKPTEEEFREKGATATFFEETNGHYLVYQQDDLDKDGIWDELFFMVDIAAQPTKTIYLYIGFTERGLFEHKTHASIGWYSRHPVPFWEAEYIGWKLYYPTDVDMHGKRKPMLTAYPEYQGNLGGYYMPFEYGTDIMAVGNTFGAGGICLFENPAYPDSISRPRFSPFKNRGPLYDTRYSFDVVANGPVRSMIRVKTMNWHTDTGEYELEQLYTAYARKSFSTCKVTFTKFLPERCDVSFGCGIRKVMGEYKSYHNGGIIMSFGKDFNPYPPMTFNGSTLVSYRDFRVGFEGIALVVKDNYKPDYVDIKSFEGNYGFRIPATPDRSYEYMIMGGWNEGVINNTEEKFREYVLTEALKYNTPIHITIGPLEEK